MCLVHLRNVSNRLRCASSTGAIVPLGGIGRDRASADTEEAWHGPLVIGKDWPRRRRILIWRHAYQPEIDAAARVEAVREQRRACAGARRDEACAQHVAAATLGAASAVVLAAT